MFLNEQNYALFFSQAIPLPLPLRTLDTSLCMFSGSSDSVFGSHACIHAKFSYLTLEVIAHVSLHDIELTSSNTIHH
jgi:hypothetical protein